MASSKYARLLADLQDATAAGRVRWEKTAEETMFRTVLGKGMVRIDRRLPYGADGSSEEPVHVLYLLTDDGNVVDAVEIRADDPESTVAGELYQMARRSAGNVDALLDSMLRDLGARTVKQS